MNPNIRNAMNAGMTPGEYIQGLEVDTQMAAFALKMLLETELEAKHSPAYGIFKRARQKQVQYYVDVASDLVTAWASSTHPDDMRNNMLNMQERLGQIPPAVNWLAWGSMSKPDAKMAVGNKRMWDRLEQQMAHVNVENIVQEILAELKEEEAAASDQLELFEDGC